jgi:hypothetical protein
MNRPKSKASSLPVAVRHRWRQDGNLASSGRLRREAVEEAKGPKAKAKRPRRVSAGAAEPRRRRVGSQAPSRRCRPVRSRRHQEAAEEMRGPKAKVKRRRRLSLAGNRESNGRRHRRRRRPREAEEVRDPKAKRKKFRRDAVGATPCRADRPHRRRRRAPQLRHRVRAAPFRPLLHRARVALRIRARKRPARHRVPDPRPLLLTIPNWNSRPGSTWNCARI